MDIERKIVNLESSLDAAKERICFFEDKVDVLQEIIIGLIESESHGEPKINEVMISIIAYIEDMNKRGFVVSKSGVINSARKGRHPFYESQDVVRKNINRLFDQEMLSWTRMDSGDMTITVGDFCHAFRGDI